MAVGEGVGTRWGVDYEGAAGVFVEVGAADAAPVDGDCDFVGGGTWWRRDCFDADVGGGVETGCFHGGGGGVGLGAEV